MNRLLSPPEPAARNESGAAAAKPRICFLGPHQEAPAGTDESPTRQRKRGGQPTGNPRLVAMFVFLLGRVERPKDELAEYLNQVRRRRAKQAARELGMPIKTVRRYVEDHGAEAIQVIRALVIDVAPAFTPPLSEHDLLEGVRFSLLNSRIDDPNELRAVYCFRHVLIVDNRDTGGVPRRRVLSAEAQRIHDDSRRVDIEPFRKWRAYTLAAINAVQLGRRLGYLPFSMGYYYAGYLGALSARLAPDEQLCAKL